MELIEIKKNDERRLKLFAEGRNTAWMRNERLGLSLRPLDIKILQTNNIRVFSMWDAQESAMYGGACARFSSEDSSLEIEYVWTSPEKQGKGVARKLIEQLVSDAPENVDFLKLTVSTVNKAAIRLYKKSGFRIRRLCAGGNRPNSYEMVHPVNGFHFPLVPYWLKRIKSYIVVSMLFQKNGKPRILYRLLYEKNK